MRQALVNENADYVTKYGKQARVVLEALLEKYADEGIEHVEDMGVLNVQLISEFGTPVEIINMFAGKDEFMRALLELEQAIYTAAA